MTTMNLAQTATNTGTGYLISMGESQPRRVEVQEFLTIGRDPGNHLSLEDEFASGRHARIERKAGGFLVRDLKSRNGTYLNGSRILEAMLTDGDRLQIGKSEFLFTWSQSELKVSLQSKNLFWNTQLEKIPSIAHSQFAVLLTGPSGTGKDVLAQAIHRSSGRKAGPFVSVNCSALSESLVESELFGHVKGGFTGATHDRKGAFEAARGGTLFLDEIGDLPLSLQPKLLRALENQQIRPVGSDRCVQTDVRIIAATHHDLRRLVQDERFRADLYFRLHVVHLHTPPLKERMEDFEDLLYGFAKDMRVRFSHSAIEALKRHSWPGNIRELKNVVARARAYWGQIEIKDADIPLLLDLLPEGEKSEAALRQTRSVIREIEYEMIKRRLIANRGNQRKTAADLGMPKSTLNDRIRVYGIDVQKLL